MANDSEILLRKLTRREFRNRMQGGELKACIIPVAAIEQHWNISPWNRIGGVFVTSPNKSPTD